LLSDDAPVAVGQDPAPVTGSSTTAMLRWVIVGLVAVAVALLALTAGYWRHTRPARPAGRASGGAGTGRPSDGRGADDGGGAGGPGGAAVAGGPGEARASGAVPGRPDGGGPGAGAGGVPTVVVRGAGADAGARGFSTSPVSGPPAR
jgi:hypothetical protein